MKHKHRFERKIDEFAVYCKCGLKLSGLEMASKIVKEDYQEITISKNTLVR